MANLFSLSPELIIMIVQRITEGEDLLNLRQSCKPLEQYSKPQFLRCFFYERRHMFSRHSLEALSEIVSDAVFGPTLHTLVIGTDHVTTDTPSKEPSKFMMILESSPTYKKVVINKSNYDRYQADQNTLLNSGLATAYLTSILSKAVNCKTLMIDDNHRAWGAKFLKQETGAYPTTDLDQSDSQEFIAKAFEATIAAVVASAISLEALKINPGSLTRPISPEILACPRLQLREAPCSTSLARLALAIEALDSESWPRSVTEFILQFPRLKTLELAFEPRVNSRCFRAIIQSLYLPHLQNLTLTEVNCREDDLALLFRAHQMSLQEITLEIVNLRGGSWRSLLATIRRHLQLTRLAITECLQDNRYISVRGDDTDPSSIQIKLTREP